jgi:hypothetical protein
MGNAQKMQYMRAQLQALQQEQQLKEFALMKAKAQWDEANAWNQPAGGSAPTAQSAPAGGPSIMAGAGSQPDFMGGNPSLMPPIAPAMSGQGLPPGVQAYAGMPLEKLRARMNAGLEPKEAMEFWKAANIGTAMAGGQYRVLPGQAPTYLPNPKDGVTLGSDGTLQMIPNAGAVLGGLAGATRGGELDATNARTPIPLDLRDRLQGAPLSMSMADLLRGNAAPSPTGSLGQLPDGPATRTLPNGQQVYTGTRAAALADMAARGQDLSTMKVNGIPVNAAPPSSPASLAFKTPAGLAAEKILAENAANLATKPALTSADTLARNDQDSFKSYNESLNNAVKDGLFLQQRNAEIRANLAQFQAGLSAGHLRGDIATNLANMFPGNADVQKLAGKILGGGPDAIAAAGTFQNLIAGAAVTNANQVLDGNGHLSRPIVSMLAKGAETSGSDPAALARIMDVQDNLVNQLIAEQRWVADQRRSGKLNPGTVESDWAQEQQRLQKDPTSVFAPASLRPATKIQPGPAPSAATMRWNAKTGKIESVN